MSHILPPSLSGATGSRERLDRVARELHDNPFGRLACPFSRVYPDEHLSRTCLRGSPDIRHVKEHLKKHHKCDCPSSDQAARCRNRLHLTPNQQTSIYRNRRRRDEEAGEQWIRIFQQMFPDATTVPAPHLMPRGLEYLVAITRTQPPGFTELLRSRLSGSRFAGGNERRDVSNLYHHARIFLETVLSSPQALQTIGRNQAAAGVVDARSLGVQAVGETFDAEPEIRMESYERVSEWIDEYMSGSL